MTEQGNTPDLSALESRLAGLRRDMDAALGGAVRRRTVSLVVSIILVVAAIIYMSWFSSQLNKLFKQTTIDELANIAEDRLNAEIDKQSSEFTQMALDQAPEMADRLEEEVMKAPAELSNRFRAFAKDELNAKVKEYEPQIHAALNEVVDNALAKSGKEQLTEAEFKAVLGEVSEELANRGSEAIKELRRIYKTGGESPPGADDIMALFERLADDRGLNDREKHLRKVVRQTLAVMAKYREEKGGI